MRGLYEWHRLYAYFSHMSARAAMHLATPPENTLELGTYFGFCKTCLLRKFKLNLNFIEIQLLYIFNINLCNVQFLNKLCHISTRG